MSPHRTICGAVVKATILLLIIDFPVLLTIIMLQSKIYLKFALLCLLRKVWRALDQPVTNKDSRDSNHLLRRRDIQRGKHLAGEPRTSGAQKISCKRLRNILRQVDEIALIFGFS